ncbi:CYTH and CHAD domain-containing protein [uncultured Nisaea sp.]|uniref:CYTH and CHAD domain-containing protein n=1 Tax=uncultured Nisaea sp. TaxID=538215 RepID=UPI0030EB72DA|tara:strand:- start:1571 stop:3163 length:1593 start_codon:yes stop_codon:yes gene_type:complete
MSKKTEALPTESELRLALSDKWVNRLKRLPILVKSTSGRAKTTHLKSTYFDTPDKELAAAGINLRIREIGRRKLQTLKIGSGWQAGITERIELEGWVNDNQPTLELIHAPEIRDLLIRNGLWERLQPAFVTDFRRSSRVVSYSGRFGDALISADLDIGEIRSGTRKAPICELELELKTGTPTALFELARAINDDVPVRIEYRGKAMRAGELQVPPEPKPTKGRRPALTQGSRINESAVAILKACQTQIAANEFPILESMAPEGPHQMRVAVRRLRAALGMFRAFGDMELIDRVRAEGKWLAGSLGEAREWDVYISDLHDPVESALGADIPALKDLRALAQARQEAGYRDARAAVASSRFTSFQLELGLLIESLSHGRGKTVFDHLARSEEFAATKLEKRYRKVCKMGRTALLGDTAAKHELRLEMKKMRYAAEFFASLFDPRKAKTFSKSAARLQDLLGYANDYAVCIRQLESLVVPATGADAPDLLKASGMIIGWHGAEMARADHEIDDAWNRFLDAGRFWPKKSRSAT